MIEIFWQISPPMRQAQPPHLKEDEVISQSQRDSARLFIADDHPLILESLRGVFQTLDPAAEVAAFGTVSGLEAALENGKAPDLVLIDFDMPGLARVDAVARFLGRHPDIPIAVISGHADTPLTWDLIRLGCAGFVPKSLAPNAIYHAIRLMIGGGRFLPDCLIESPPPPAPAQGSALTGPASRQKFGLTRREVEVLRSLATGQTNKQIARALNIEEVTVKLHLRRGYAKLRVRNRIEAVRAVFDGALD